jgi:hypothetical protein
MERVLIRNRVSQYFDEPESRILIQPRFSIEKCIPKPEDLRVLRKSFELKESTPENAVSILREDGIKAKIFAIHSSRKQEFEVKSREFDWEVAPLAKSNVKVPSEILERINLLLHEGIEIERLYIAKPKQYALAGLLKSEITTQGKILSEEIASIAIGFLAGAEEAVKVLKEARKRKQNPVTMIPRYLPDPALIAKIKGHNELIEVGRWL